MLCLSPLSLQGKKLTMNNYAVLFFFSKNFLSQFKLWMHLNNMWIPSTGIYLLPKRGRLYSKKLWHQPGRKTKPQVELHLPDVWLTHRDPEGPCFFIKKSAEEVWFGLSLSSELIIASSTSKSNTSQSKIISSLHSEHLLKRNDGDAVKSKNVPAKLPPFPQHSQKRQLHA